MSKYSHLVTMKSKQSVFKVRVNAKYDSLAYVLFKYDLRFTQADSVTAQKYPLKDNEIEILK